MHTLRNADVETCIAELKSDIIKVNMQLKKIKNLTETNDSDSRLRTGILDTTKGATEMEEVVKSLISENVWESRYKLQQFLNEKMLDVETLVFKLISDPGDPMPSPSMSRLKVWTKLLDRHLWTYFPESVRNTPKTSRPQALRNDQLAPLQNLLWHHSVICDALPSDPNYLAVAAEALGTKIGELYRKIEGQRAELNTMKETPNQQLEEASDITEMKKDLIAAKNNVLMLTKRVTELGEVTSNVQETLTREKAEHEVDLQFSKKCRKEWEKKVEDLEAEFSSARSKILELKNQLKLRGSRDSKNLTLDHTWEIKLMRENHCKEMEELRDKNREIVHEVMYLKESNSDFMKTLTTRDSKMKAMRNKDQSYYNIVALETEAMRKAFEIELASINRKLELAKAETRRIEQRGRAL